ncbi:MAG: hypothetical protein M9894_11345 [Planctomycetes bacterium]|nr:hypothetical protein [Planctomycetota bacterium]
MKHSPALAVAAALVVATLAAAAAVLLRPRADLLLVNPGPTPARVVVGGQAVEVPAAGTLSLPGVPTGGLLLEAPGVAAIRSDLGGTSRPPHPTWVWAVAPVEGWWAASKGYGDQAHQGESAAPFEAPGALFRLPPDFLPAVDGPLPEQVAAKRGSTGVVRKVLWTEGHVERARTRQARVLIFNSTRYLVKVETPKQVLADELVPGGHVEAVDVPRGRLTLRATPVGVDHTVFEAEVDVEPGAPLGDPTLYVWDLSGQTPFWVVSRRYGVDPDAGEPAPGPRRFERPEGQALFRLPDGFLPHLDKKLPDTWHRAGVLHALWSDGFYSAPPFELGTDAVEALLPGMSRRRTPPTDDGPGATPFPPVDEGD